MGNLYGLKYYCFPRNKRWQIDQDYVKKLSDKEKEWLSKFNQEFYDGKFSKKPLHKSKKLRRECYTRTNCVNRDLFAIKNCLRLILGLHNNHDDVAVECNFDMVESNFAEIDAQELFLLAHYLNIND